MSIETNAPELEELFHSQSLLWPNWLQAEFSSFQHKQYFVILRCLFNESLQMSLSSIHTLIR